MEIYRIVDSTTGRAITFVEAKTNRGAILKFRKNFNLQHNYPHVVAIHMPCVIQ